MARPTARSVRIFLLALIVVGTCIPGVQAATYKWTDEKGVVHYTDKIPPEAINKGNVEINKQGVTVKKTDPAMTQEQRRAREVEEERARMLAKEREIVERRDKALLSTYTMESEIDLARTRALNTIDAQIQSANSYTALLNKRKVELEARRTALGDKPMPAALDRELSNINVTLTGQAELIATKHKEMMAVTARYDLDKRRWQELRAAGEVNPRGSANVVPTTTAK
ncbi:MAG: DUF4124 domain-containing protein [Betaproteobacteria bacterium]